MTVLDLAKLDLSDLCIALEDNSPEHSWWIDPHTGETELWSEDVGDELGIGHPDDRDLTWIEPIGSHEAYGDMEEFVERVRDSRARNLLGRAIEGRGAFRRFKDTLLEFPELREAWFAFHDVRVERRALDWLAGAGLVDGREAERAIVRRPDPDLPEISGAFDPNAIAAAVAEELRGLYGERLRQVLLFGSWARGDAHPESDIDLLVVLDRIDSRREERDRMSAILWRHSLDNDTVVTEVPVTEEELEAAELPLLTRVRGEAVRVA
jgi:predicted nucleotidyltransferase